MTADEEQRARRLFDLIGTRGKGDQFRKLVERSESFGEFRVLLVMEGELTKGVKGEWRRKLSEARVETDGRSALHDLEILSLKQVELEALLRANEATLIEKLRVLDESARELTQLASSVREIRAALAEYRLSISELAGRVPEAEVHNGLTRAGG